MDVSAGPSSSGPPEVPAGLAFPGAVRLELDDLLDQVIARASELKSVQGRLRKLLASTHHIAQRLDPDELRRRVVDSARGLVDARHAALGIVDGTRASFVHTGLRDEEVAALAELATGDGVLRPLIADSHPLRLRRLADGPHSALPSGSFLGVPLRVGRGVYGHLYLVDKQGAEEFSRDDEELLTTLAGAAGVAVENALLLDGARRRARWQAAAADLSRRLLAGSLDPPSGLRHLLDEALVLSDGDGAVLTTVDDRDPTWIAVPCATGALVELEDRRFPLDGTITDAALTTGRAIVISAVPEDRRATQLAEVAPAVGSALAMRLSDGIAGDGTHAVLVLVRDAGRRSFDDDDVDLVEGLAAQASATLAVARSRADREALRRVEDRESLVADLNTRVLQRLLRVGTALSSAASAAQPPTRDRVLAQVDELDDLVRELRRAVWQAPGRDAAGADVPGGQAPPARLP
ncbi:GAF domain-containing protein [Actinomycetospora endophytica]|uniref:GAF domain-containing protein n=1 Tax=Actinomycetospora endophytica TaxID=2291215 RepID=A0ABS8PD49_9PSEU|nr:GAF domain-containing protein [Actinomycetospora endophytica]MCD2195832.1 GAF domain-containing protein [Actinomycetospora endophytica]